MFERKFFAGWGDMDSNSHMINTAFLAKAADVRLIFFAENGFPMEEFTRLKFGPLAMKDEIEYFKEIRLLEEFKVDVSIAGLSENGSCFRLRNRFWRLGGKLAAQVTSSAGWLDWANRKLMAPSDALLLVLKSLPKTDDFQIISSSFK